MENERRIKKLEEIEKMNIPVGALIEVSFLHPSYIEKKPIYYLGIEKNRDGVGLKFSKNKLEQHGERFDNPEYMTNLEDISKITILAPKK